MLKIAIAIIVAVFEREDELPFSKDFSTCDINRNSEGRNIVVCILDFFGRDKKFIGANQFKLRYLYSTIGLLSAGETGD